MHELEVFVFNIINFCILMTVLFLLVHRGANQFFYARRDRIRKEMLSAVMELRKARSMATRSRNAYECLPEDITARRNAIEDICKVECRAIVEDAQRRAEHILDAAARRARDDRERAALLLKEQILVRAFASAREQLARMSTPELQQEFVERGFQQLPKFESALQRRGALPVPEG